MIELLTVKQMAEADRLTVAGGTSGIDLMERAGRAVADIAAARMASGGRVAVAAGPGNNGGDGFVAARILAERGYAVRLALLGDLDRLTGDAAISARRWEGAVDPLSPDSFSNADLIVDALFGAGLARTVEGMAKQVIEAANASGKPVIAVDLPSGISGDTGLPMGAAVRATDTITFFRRKPAHLLMPGRAHCGEVHVADIGIQAGVLDRIRPAGFENQPGLWRSVFPRPKPDGHKYDRGHAVVVSGGLTTTGAARLAARSALRSGAGLVTLASPRDALAMNAAASLAVMVRPAGTAKELGALLKDRRFNAVAIGPGAGVGVATRAKVTAVLKTEAKVVLDAEALTSFGGQSQMLGQMIAARNSTTVLTPHTGEFDRLFNKLSTKTKVNSKLEKARLAASEVGGIVLLKGPDTVIAHPDGRAAITGNAPPYLATAGSGDVLAGMILGLLAQGMPAFEAACAAAWLHGEAASEFGPGLIAEDIETMLPGVLNTLLG